MVIETLLQGLREKTGLPEVKLNTSGVCRLIFNHALTYTDPTVVFG